METLFTVGIRKEFTAHKSQSSETFRRVRRKNKYKGSWFHYRVSKRSSPGGSRTASLKFPLPRVASMCFRS
jgi:hypothetical protein